MSSFIIVRMCQSIFDTDTETENFNAILLNNSNFFEVPPFSYNAFEYIKVGT